LDDDAPKNAFSRFIGVRQIPTAPVNEQLHELLFGKDRSSTFIFIGLRLLQIFAKRLHHVTQTRVKLLAKLEIVILWHALPHLPDIVETNGNRLKFCRVEMLSHVGVAFFHILQLLP
jgi:CRP-like cAMP-binding protein